MAGDYNDSSEMRSAVNWSFKDTQLKFYEYATMSYGNFLRAAQGIASKSKEGREFIAALLAYHSTVLNGFKAYLGDDKEGKGYKIDFPDKKYQFKEDDYYFENLFEAKHDEVVRMATVLFFWSQQYGPFATLTKHIDPGDSWAMG